MARDSGAAADSSEPMAASPTLSQESVRGAGARLTDTRTAWSMCWIVSWIRAW